MPANTDNLKRCTPEEAREQGRKGGLASAEARRQKRDIRRALETLLEMDYDVNIPSSEGKKGGKEKRSGAEALALIVMGKAMRGDLEAFKVVRDTTGQKPVDKVLVAEVDADAIDEVAEMVYAARDKGGSGDR